MLTQFCRRNSEYGFTLMELMIVVAIIGIISLIAVPSYFGQVRKTHRAEAKTTLASGSQAMERCFTTFSTYTNPNCPKVSNLSSMGGNFFNYTIASSTSTYTITAMANAAKNQDKDTACITFTINNRGLKTAADIGGNAKMDCW